MLARLALVIALVLPLRACAQAPAPSRSSTLASTATDPDAVFDEAWRDAIAATRAHIRDLVDEATPGISVAVGVRGRVVWAEGFGWADAEARRPVTVRTQFRVGSVSKPISSIAVGELIDSGRLDLDAPVQKYVPTFPEKPWPVTTRELGGHLAGVRHYKSDDEMYRSKHYETAAGGLEVFQADPLLFEPGTRFHYSSYGWNLVGAVVEGAAGVSFPIFMRTRVFEPLGLAHTAIDDAGREMPDRTGFYEKGARGAHPARATDNSYKWASGGFLSTPSDLVRFGFSVLHPTLVRPETMALLLTPQKTRAGESTHYGIGWGVGRTPSGRESFGHSGGSVGGTTEFVVVPDAEVVVAMTANVGGLKGLDDAAREAVDTFASASGTAAAAGASQGRAPAGAQP
jgi:serine beta-lactamase-like protein LACTB, mitochondrial